MVEQSPLSDDLREQLYKTLDVCGINPTTFEYGGTTIDSYLQSHPQEISVITKIVVGQIAKALTTLANQK